MEENIRERNHELKIKNKKLKIENKNLNLKLRRFKNFTIVGLTAILTAAGVVSINFYNKGKQVGMEKKEEQLFDQQSTTCNINNAQPLLLLKWANYAYGQLVNACENESYDYNSFWKNEKDSYLENIRTQYFYPACNAYDNFISSGGNMEEYYKLVNCCIALENAINDIQYVSILASFDDSIYSHMILIDENNQVVNSITANENLLMYTPIEFYNDQYYDSNSIIYNNIIYSEYSQSKSKTK